KQEMQERVREKATAMAEERILDILIPPVKKAGTVGYISHDAIKSENASDTELNEGTRQRFREKLRAGDLEDREIEIEVKSNKNPMMQVFGPVGMEEMGINLQDMLGNIGKTGKKTKR